MSSASPSSWTPGASPLRGANPRQRELAGRLVLLAAMLISVAAHVFLLGYLRDRPMGPVNPQWISQHREVFAIRRADRDYIIDDRQPFGAEDPSSREPNSLAELSKTLLATGEQPKRSSDSLVSIDIRPMDEQRTEDLAPLLAVTLPSTEVGGPVDQALVGQLALDVAYVPESSGNGFSDGVAGKGDPEARRLLARSGLVPAAPSPPRVLTPPAPVELAPGDDLLRTAPPLPLDIDFADLVLDATTQLQIPEHLDEDFEYTLAVYQPRRGWFSGDDDLEGYFRVDIKARRSLQKLRTMPKDMVFVLDVSGSVTQAWVNAAIQGLADALGNLNPGDRFNIVLFHESLSIFSPVRIVPVSEQAVVDAARFLSQAKSGGETDVNRALSRLLVRDVDVDRVYNVVLISDGRPTRGVMDTRQLINIITRDNDLVASIYCIGIGTNQNQELLEFLAYRNKGFCVFAANTERATAAIRDLVSRLRYPVIRDVRLQVAGLDGQKVFPRDLPNIHQGESFAVYGRFDQPSVFTMQMTGRNSAQKVDFTFSLDLAKAPSADKDIAEQWAFWKLHHLYSEMIRRGDDPAVREEIKQLRRQYKLKTLY